MIKYRSEFETGVACNYYLFNIRIYPFYLSEFIKSTLVCIPSLYKLDLLIKLLIMSKLIGQIIKNRRQRKTTSLQSTEPKFLEFKWNRFFNFKMALINTSFPVI